MGPQEDRYRSISANKDFLSHKNGNDLLYTYLLQRATYDKESRQFYITHLNYLTERDFLKKILECKTTRTVDNTISKMVEQDLLIHKSTIISRGKEEVCYYFINPQIPYNKIDCDLLRYLVNTRSVNAVRVYNFLRKGWEIYRNKDEDFSFTLNDIKRALEYNIKSPQVNDMIRMILESFSREGILEAEIRMKQAPDKQTAYKAYYLTYLVCHTDELRPSTIKDLTQKNVEPQSQPALPQQNKTIELNSAGCDKAEMKALIAKHF